MVLFADDEIQWGKIATMPVLMKDSTSGELHASLAHLGVSLRLARQLLAAVVRRDEFPATLPAVSAKLLGKIRESVELPRLSAATAGDRTFMPPAVCWLSSNLILIKFI